MVRILKIAFVALFVVCTVLFAVFFIKEKAGTDNTYPVINVPADNIELSVKCTQGELLKGVTAYDEKDGDLTDRVIVESVSRFIEPGVSKVTYAVCDSNNHVTSRTVLLHYTDYTPPRIHMTRSLCFGLYDHVDVSSVISAEDAFDGDLKKELQLSSADYVTGTLGVFTINVSATNSRGDYINYDLPMYVESVEQNAPSIVLTEYVTYVRKGDSVDPMEYVGSVTDAYREDVSDSLEIVSEVDTAQPGLYAVHYYAEDKLERRAHVMLIVIVEE